MREDLERLLDDLTLMTVTFAIAIGWSLYQTAHGVATLVDGLLTHLPANSGPFSGLIGTGGLSWQIGHRFINLDVLLIGLIELAVSVGAAVLVARRTRD